MTLNFGFTTAVRTVGTQLIFELHGELDLAVVPALRGQIIGALREFEPDRLVLDLTGLTFIDSTGLGVLIWAHGRLAERGARLHLAAPGRQVQRVLQISGLDRRLHLYDTLDEATRTP
jgi:anti-sigma B factor antagonist